MNVEIITTRNESFKETGFGTLKACASVFDAIKRVGHEVRLNTCQTSADLDEIVGRKPDLVILAIKYLAIPGTDDIWLSEYFAARDINFTGSSRDVLKFDSDKVLAKNFLRGQGIRTANHFTAIPGQYSGDADLPIAFPLFLKPSDSANGNGIDDLSFVTNFAEFDSKVLSLHGAFGVPVLAEEYLDGPEYTVAVIKPLQGDLLVSSIEIVPMQSGNGLRILGEKAKQDDSEELKKADNSVIANRVKQLAIDVFVALSIRDFGRIDIKTNANGLCFFMEANLVPGMTLGTSYFPRACEIDHGLDYDDVVALMLEEGFGRALSKYNELGVVIPTAAGLGRDLRFAALAKDQSPSSVRSYN